MNSWRCSRETLASFFQWCSTNSVHSLSPCIRVLCHKLSSNQSQMSTSQRWTPLKNFFASHPIVYHQTCDQNFWSYGMHLVPLYPWWWHHHLPFMFVTVVYNDNDMPRTAFEQRNICVALSILPQIHTSALNSFTSRFYAGQITNKESRQQK